MFGVSRPIDIALRLAPYAVIVGLVIALLIVINQRDDARHDLEIMLAEVSRKTAEARAADLAHARDTEQLQQKVTNDVEKRSNDRFAALASDYERRLRALTAAQSGGGGKAMPRVPDAARSFDAKPGGDGLLTIPTETAFALMFYCDANTQDWRDLQSWIREQQALSEDQR